MRSVPHGSNKWLPKPDFPPNPLLIDYVWRQNKNLYDYVNGRQKIIYNPQSVWGIGVHYCWTAQGTKKILQPAKGEAYVHHYKLPDRGVSRKGGKRMVKSEDNLLRDPIIRDMYRSDLVSALKEVGYLESSSANHST